MYQIFEKFVGFMWGVPLLATVIITGLYFTIRAKGFQFSHLGHIIKSVFKKDETEVADRLTPFEALSVAVGGTVGVANMSGVATAIAIGGPGATFWLWVAALLGMIIKMVEVTLAVHYRETKPDGTHAGGPTYYMQKALGEERNLKIWKPLAIIFGAGLYVVFFITIQNYTVSEAIGTTFNISYLIPATALVIITYAIILGGLKKVGQIASYLIPFMCLFYIISSLYIIFINFSKLPSVLGLIIKGAFTGQAAVGGFAGATAAQAMRFGFARSVYSNEAGWGTSPMIHATAETDHPIKQGLLGAFEVFVDTIIICTMTALVVIITGYWDSGLLGAELTLVALESVVGGFARIIVAVSIFLFGLTTCTGWYTYYAILADHAISDDSKYKNTILSLIKIFTPLTGFTITLITVFYGGTPAELWTFADFTTLVPTFVNLIVLLIIGGKFIELLNDYKARYLGVGKYDPEFILFYEDKKIKK